MKHTKHTMSALLGAVLLAGTAACSFGSTETPEPEASLPKVDDVSDREKVPTIRLLTLSAATDPTRFELSRMVVDSWKKAGIDAELMPVDSAQLTTLAFETKDYDVYTVSYGPSLDRLDPDNLLARFRSANATESGSNVSMYVSDAYDEAYSAQSRAVDEQSRVEAVRTAQNLIYEDLPVVPIFYPVVGAAYRSDRWDGIEPALGNPVFNLWNATRATPRDDRDRLVVGTTVDPPTLNPVAAETVESQISLSLIYDTLLSIGPDGEQVNRAAESVDAEADQVTVKLRQGMTFSDGRPVRPEDVAFTIDYLKENGAPLYSAPLENVDSVSVSGDTLVIKLSSPAASFVDVSLTQMPILPEHIWAGVDGTTFVNEKPVGSGAFVLSERRVGDSLTFTAREDHYEPPVINELELVILGSFDAGIGAVESGEIDMLDDLQPAQQYAPLKDVEGVTVVETQSHGWRGLHFNTSRAPLDDLAFRQALTDLVPYEDIIDVVMRGEAQPGGSIIAPVLETWHDPALEPFEYDPEAAAETLEEAGYAAGSDGSLYFPEGHPSIGSDN